MAVYTTVMTVTELQSILCGWPSISNRSKIYKKYINFVQNEFHLPKINSILLLEKVVLSEVFL